MGAPLPRHGSRGASWGIVLALVLPASAQGAQEEGSCASCHPEVAKSEAGRPHARSGVRCTDCHGGDASRATKEEAKAAGTGFRGALGGVETVELCGGCHADVRRMNPYGLPTDQLAQYRTSRHGELLFAEHDSQVATCTSCHGAHGVLGPASRESPVHPTNVVATCARCHGDAEKMEAAGLDPGIPDAWRKSVHGALLERGDVSAPQCATCHGSHGAVPPGFSSVGAVCGRCHVRERALFQESPHAPLVEEGDFPGCETCHGNHEVRPAELAILERMCTLCHSEGEPAIERRDAILAALRSTRELLASTENELRLAAQHGLTDDRDRLLLEQARTTVEQLQVQQHTLDASRVTETGGEARDTLQRLSGHLRHERERARLKRLSTVPVVAFLLMMSLGFWIRFRRIHRHARAEDR